MSTGYLPRDQQVQVRGPDGSILWVGTALVGVPYLVKNTEATASIALGEAVRFDATNGVIPRLETTAAGASPTADLPQTSVYAGLRIAATTDIMFMGVATEPIAAGKIGLVAGTGSITTVRTTATTIVVGALIGGSATAGAAATIATSATLGVVLGICFKTNTVAAPGTGTTAHAGVLVAPQH